MNEILMCGTDPVGQLYKDTKAEATSIAPIEVSPAESSHSVGTHIMVDGVRYRVTSAISIGDTLTIGTNISAENIEDNLNATHIPYDSNTSVKEKLDSMGYREVGRASLNQTFAQQLTQLKTAYDSLSGIEKLGSIIFTANQFFYLTNTDNGRAIYSSMVVGGAFACTSLDINNATMKFISGSFTVTDSSTSVNNSIMFLYVLDKLQ